MTTEAANAASGGNAPKGKILVVDDDRLVLATVMHGLAHAGYEVIDADNGDDAILLAREHKPDLALLDIRMDGISGFDVAEYLREVGHTPFIFLSAFSDAATVAKVTQLGALAYLVKPLEVGQIVPTVDAAFERARAMAAQTAATANAAEAQEMDDPAVVLSQTVAMAVGVLMHRYSQTRGDALARLRRHAVVEGRSLRAQADRVVRATEDLSSPEA
jgi:two-component system, response regulator PdtaR